MLDAIDICKLHAYKRKMGSYYERYGEKIWALHYQTDVSTRKEQSASLKCNGLASYNKAWEDLVRQVGTGKAQTLFSHPYDPAHPWDYVMGAALKDTTWRFEDMSLALMHDNNKPVSSAIDGDVKIGDNVQQPRQRPPTPPGTTGISASPRVRPAPPALKHARTAKQRSVCPRSGVYKTNRTGMPLCDNSISLSSAHTHNLGRRHSVWAPWLSPRRRRSGKRCVCARSRPGQGGRREAWGHHPAMCGALRQ